MTTDGNNTPAESWSNVTPAGMTRGVSGIAVHPANASIVAQSRVVLDTGQRTRTVVQFRSSDLRPTAYQIEVTGGGGQNITGRATGNRFRATTVSADGERMREYLVDPNAVVIADEIAHQHYFIARALDGSGSVPVILPRQNRQVTAHAEARGSETIQIDGRSVSARRIDIDIAGLDPRRIWVDARNRVLRLTIPAQDLLAVRTSLP